MQNSPFTLKNSDHVVLFHCHNAEHHQHVTAHLDARPIACAPSPLYFLRRQARAHFRNIKTEEKSRSDCAQLAEMQRIL